MRPIYQQNTTVSSKSSSPSTGQTSQETKIVPQKPQRSSTVSTPTTPPLPPRKDDRKNPFSIVNESTAAPSPSPCQHNRKNPFSTTNGTTSVHLVSCPQLPPRPNAKENNASRSMLPPRPPMTAERTPAVANRHHQRHDKSVIPDLLPRPTPDLPPRLPRAESQHNREQRPTYPLRKSMSNVEQVSTNLTSPSVLPPRPIGFPRQLQVDQQVSNPLSDLPPRPTTRLAKSDEKQLMGRVAGSNIFEGMALFMRYPHR